MCVCDVSTMGVCSQCTCWRWVCTACSSSCGWRCISFTGQLASWVSFEVMVCVKVCVGCLFSLLCCYCGMPLQFTYIRWLALLPPPQVPPTHETVPQGYNSPINASSEFSFKDSFRDSPYLRHIVPTVRVSVDVGPQWLVSHERVKLKNVLSENAHVTIFKGAMTAENGMNSRTQSVTAKTIKGRNCRGEGVSTMKWPCVAKQPNMGVSVCTVDSCTCLWALSAGSYLQLISAAHICSLLLHNDLCWHFLQCISLCKVAPKYVCVNADPSNEGDLEDLFHEMQLMSQLAPHPNIVKLLGVITQGLHPM